MESSTPIKLGDENSAVVIAALRKKVLEFEKLFAKEATKSAPAADESLASELQVSRRNCSILSQNVETLKGVSLQLAAQLEEANIRLATFEEKQKINALRLERDLSIEIENMKAVYEKRLETMREAIKTHEEGSQQTIQILQNREDAALKRIAQLERAKDNTIRELTHEIEILRAGSSMRQQQSARHQTSKKQSSSSVAVEEPMRQEWRSTLGRQHSSEDICVVTMSVAMQPKDVEQARFLNSMSANPLENAPRSIAVADPAMHVDVTADCTVLQQLQLPSPGRVGSSRWGFQVPTGQQIIINVDIV